MCMSVLEKLTFFCKSYSEPVAQLVECKNWDRRVAGSRLTRSIFLILCLAVLFQPRETGKPPDCCIGRKAYV